MRIPTVPRTTGLLAAFTLASTAISTQVAAAPSGNPLPPLLMTTCLPDELGQVTQVLVLDSQQANAIFKKGKAPQVARPGEVWVQIFARSKTGKDSSLDKVDRAPTAAEIKETVGKRQCVVLSGH